MAGRIIWKNCTNTTHMPRSTQMARQRCQMKGSWSSARTSSEGCCWNLLVRFQGFKALGHSAIQPPNFKNEKTGTFQRSKTQGSHVENRMWVLDFQCNFLSINNAVVSSRFFQVYGYFCFLWWFECFSQSVRSGVLLHSTVEVSLLQGCSQEEQSLPLANWKASVSWKHSPAFICACVPKSHSRNRKTCGQWAASWSTG